MSRNSTGRSIRLRLALAMAALAALVTALALGGLTLWTTQSIDEDADEEILSELEELLGHHDERGWRSLAAEVERRTRHGAYAESVYIFAEERFETISGNLHIWPEAVRTHSRMDTYAFEERSSSVRIVRSVRFQSRGLADGRHLLVGQDVTDEQDFVRTLRNGALAAFGGAVLLALGAGLTVSRGLLGRVDGMNATVLRILGGHADERVPVQSGGDEFDRLAAHFNRLLDEKGRLIERMREVTDDVAHDLRTPLARMRTHIESALAAPQDSARTSESLHQLLDETNGLLDTFNALLRIAQIESGAVRDEMEELDLDAAVRDAVELYLPVAEEAGVALETALAPGLRIRADRHLLAQALTNLIDNALKYGAGGGRVTVATQQQSDRVELSVTDGGPGIPAEQREHVLERFVRLDSSRNRPGTGLGLSFVSAVAELHGGEVRLEDAAPGLRAVLAFPAAPSAG